MVAAKTEAGGAATAYFRTARPLPSLVTALALGYFAVRRRTRRGTCSRPAPPSEGEGLCGSGGLRVRAGRLPRLLE